MDSLSNLTEFVFELILMKLSDKKTDKYKNFYIYGQYRDLIRLFYVSTIIRTRTKKYCKYLKLWLTRFSVNKTIAHKGFFKEIRFISGYGIHSFSWSLTMIEYNDFFYIDILLPKDHKCVYYYRSNGISYSDEFYYSKEWPCYRKLTIGRYSDILDTCGIHYIEHLSKERLQKNPYLPKALILDD
jgi:hypothetical protein